MNKLSNRWNAIPLVGSLIFLPSCGAKAEHKIDMLPTAASETQMRQELSANGYTTEICQIGDISTAEFDLLLKICQGKNNDGGFAYRGELWGLGKDGKLVSLRKLTATERKGNPELYDTKYLVTGLVKSLRYEAEAEAKPGSIYLTNRGGSKNGMTYNGNLLNDVDRQVLNQLIISDKYSNTTGQEVELKIGDSFQGTVKPDTGRLGFLAYTQKEAQERRFNPKRGEIIPQSWFAVPK